MDRFFCRDFLIFVTYALAVYWGICIERSVQEIRDQNRPFQCSPVLEGLVEQMGAAAPVQVPVTMPEPVGVGKPGTLFPNEVYLQLLVPPREDEVGEAESNNTT
jgi:hypothetical protein